MKAMTQPSKGAAVFLTLFGLMFLVPSLLAAFVFLTKSPNNSPAGMIAGVAIAFFMAAIGATLIFAAIGGYRKMKQQAAVEEAHAASPWLWRKDWAVRTAKSQNKGKAITLWVICTFVSMILLPITIALLPTLPNQFDPRTLPIFGFDAIGLILIVYALRATLRQRRFGETYFEFYSLPFSPGERLTGRIHLKLDANAEHGVDLRLSCVRKTVTGSGNNRSTVETILWQADQNVPSGAIAMDASGRAIPVDFEIPADAYVTDHDNLSDQVVWMLHAQADVPGIDYTDDFEVPVFRTASSPSTVPSGSSSSSGMGFGFSETSSSDADAVTLPAPKNPKVIITPQSNGTEFYFPPFRNPGRTLFLLLFTAIWTGVVYFLFHSKAPWFFALVFALADVFLIFAALHVSVGSIRICVGNGEITRASRILGIGSTKRFPVSEIEAIVPVTGGQQSSSSGSTVYSIRLRTKNGKRCTLADDIASRQEARWIVSQIESLAGLKINTKVEIDAPLGVPMQPPQPGQAVFHAAGGRSSSRISNVIAFAVFAGIAVCMFAVQGWRWSSVKSLANSRANRPRPAQRATVNLGKPAAKPPAGKTPAPVNVMSEENAQRILTLPAQEQAEELLERAIQHDPKARQLFEDNVEEWVGHIRLTDHMRQLENRSQYSSDLRVRYANADLFLTLDGWQKNEQAADMLIERARTDLHYRPAAVFFLGMLAGRGVAYDKIHPVLLDYAKHDPDPSVRQWAVEGMRYLGKDEALDELWESFTEDPSMNVRDRAGCNLSDCGNFTRRQRMRIVPKFLELLGDNNLNPQMRTWCFMALHEITDENLPSDVQAWRTWYGQHGAAKLAEFERLDWWQVRGDE